MVLQACDPSTWKAKAGGLEIQGKPPLPIEFKARFEYKDLSIKK